MKARKIKYLASTVAVLALAMTGCAAPNTGTTNTSPAASGGEVPDKPSAPVALHIPDVAGNQKLTGQMVEDFVAHPTWWAPSSHRLTAGIFRST